MRRLLLALAALLAAAPAAAAQDPVATVPAVTPLKALGDTVAWSARGAAPGDPYRLTVRRDGVVETVPVAAREQPGDFDLGTDATGAPLLVYTRCAATCDLFSSTLDGVERRIAGASSPHYDESVPTVWRGRLAWARRDVVYTRRLSDASSVPSRRLLRLPRRTCPEPDFRCAATRERSIDELELYGRNLGVLSSLVEPTGPGFGQLRVQVLDPQSGRLRASQVLTRGLGGQTLLGLSLRGGRVAYALTCFGDPSGCRYGVRRQRLDGSGREQTRELRDLLGFAAAGLAGERAFVLRPTRSIEEGDPCPCRLEERALSWAPAA